MAAAAGMKESVPLSPSGNFLFTVSMSSQEVISVAMKVENTSTAFFLWRFCFHLSAISLEHTRRIVP